MLLPSPREIRSDAFLFKYKTGLPTAVRLPISAYNSLRLCLVEGFRKGKVRQRKEFIFLIHLLNNCVLYNSKPQ